MTSRVLAARAPATAASQQHWPADDTNTPVSLPMQVSHLAATSSYLLGIDWLVLSVSTLQMAMLC